MPDGAAPEGTLLAFDFGLKRIGVAVGQTTTRTANPLTTLRAPGSNGWRQITALFSEWRPCGVVVGLPFDAEGRETDISRAARRFATELGQRYSVPVFFMDERLTSHQVETDFAERRATGLARRRNARQLDAMAAKIILENWLQSVPADDASCAGSD